MAAQALDLLGPRIPDLDGGIRTAPGEQAAIGASWVEGVAFSPDGKWIASASLDGTVKLWPVVVVLETRGRAAGAPGSRAV